MKMLTYGQLIKLNRTTVERHGGNYMSPNNLLNEAPLLYVLDAVNAELFGEAMYPTVMDKAAVYMHGIISNHIFSDGNKRTGLGAAFVFLEINGYTIRPKPKVSDITTSSDDFGDAMKQTIYQFTLQVAAGEHDLDAVRAWFKEHTVALP